LFIRLTLLAKTGQCSLQATSVCNDLIDDLATKANQQQRLLSRHRNSVEVPELRKKNTNFNRVTQFAATRKTPVSVNSAAVSRWSQQVRLSRPVGAS
jgi:acetolactate synthase small subunit